MIHCAAICAAIAKFNSNLEHLADKLGVMATHSTSALSTKSLRVTNIVIHKILLITFKILVPGFTTVQRVRQSIEVWTIDGFLAPKQH